MTAVTVVKRGLYRDSVVLLTLGRELRAMEGVEDAAALMATPANRELLAGSGLLTDAAEAAGPNDLVIAIRATTDAAERARARAEELLSERARPRGAGVHLRPRTIDGARRLLAGADLALISVPGAWAAREARRALRLGLHVMLFSDNVSLEDEVQLKDLASARGLWLMGPDCGTAYLGGVPLGFANAVPRGRIGFVAASGTGLQHVVSLLAEHGEGVSQAIGVGGRDMTDAVAGRMALRAIDALASDPGTELIVVIGKPPSATVRATVEARIRDAGKLAVVALLGAEERPATAGRVTTVATLEDASTAALASLAGRTWIPRPFSAGATEVRRRVDAVRRAIGSRAGAVRGLYAGGTLADEARLIMAPLIGPIGATLDPDGAARHRVVDLGADEYTVGRAHPMIDPTARIEAIGEVAEDGDVAVLLLDVVLGHGAAADPAGDIAPAIEAARRAARQRGGDLAVVASVIGTDRDPQGRAAQTARLEQAGVWVLPSTAQAARLAACIAGGEVVLARVLADAPR